MKKYFFILSLLFCLSACDYFKSSAPVQQATVAPQPVVQTQNPTTPPDTTHLDFTLDNAIEKAAYDTITKRGQQLTAKINALNVELNSLWIGKIRSKNIDPNKIVQNSLTVGKKPYEFKVLYYK